MQSNNHRCAKDFVDFVYIFVFVYFISRIFKCALGKFQWVFWWLLFALWKSLRPIFFEMSSFVSLSSFFLANVKNVKVPNKNPSIATGSSCITDLFPVAIFPSTYFFKLLFTLFYFLSFFVRGGGFYFWGCYFRLQSLDTLGKWDS